MRAAIFRSFAFAVTAASLSGCGYFDSRSAHRAQESMIGMTSYDLQSCAGIPSATTKLNDTTQLYQYTGTLPAMSIPDSTLIPVGSLTSIFQQAFGGNGTNCVAIMRLDHDRVSEVHYTGNDDELIGEDGICSIITRGCARQPEGTMRKVQRFPFGPVSAFGPPQTPPQSTSATYSSQAGQVEVNAGKGATGPVIQPRK